VYSKPETVRVNYQPPYQSSEKEKMGLVSYQPQSELDTIVVPSEWRVEPGGDRATWELGGVALTQCTSGLGLRCHSNV
jgi:hypothetical protein